jgi:hypothetical protein
MKMRTDREQAVESGTPSYRGTAIAVGILFILCSAASILSIAPLGGALVAPIDLAKFAANDNRVLWTALIEFVWAVTGAGIAIGLYPVLKKFNPGLALGSLAGRLVENVFILIGTLFLVALLAVGQGAVVAGAAGLASAVNVSNLLLALREWIHGFLALIPFAIGTILYSYVLYRSRLVPRWLSGWGLIAGVLSLVATLYAGFTQDFGFTTVNTVLNIPIGLQEMTLAVYLIAKGFNRKGLASVAPAVAESAA